jgi:dipeptidase E
MSKRLLLLSNSKNHGQEYLEHAAHSIRHFLGDNVKTVAFVPYAGVTVPFDQYTGIVREHFGPWGYEIESVHESGDPRKTVERADAVVVGGGNTFHLLKKMYENNLIDLIRGRVNEGIPYVGWSAGSNLACPTIRTTNDMPIVEPPSFDSIHLIPFQINPHYLDQHPEGHAGETREQRILEFVEANPDMFVVGLREGSMLRLEDSSLDLLGNKPMRVFRKGQDTTECQPGDSLAFLMG